MHRTKILFFSGLSLLFGGILFILPNSVLAIGISPALVEVGDIQPNTEVEQQVFISRGDASESESARVTITGSSAQYIHLVADQVELPAGEQKVAVPFVIKPGSLADGTYLATITVYPRPKEGFLEEGQTGSFITAGAQAEIQFTVTNEEIESYTIQEVAMKDSEENQVVGFSYLMVNTGNVDTRPVKIDFSATDETDSTNTYSETISGQELPLVPAFQEKRIDVATQASLSTGIYKTNLTFYNNNDDIVFTSDKLRLQIFPEGTLDLEGELLSFSSDKPEYQEGEVVKFIGSFKNTGTVGLKTSLVVEISIDDVRTEVLKTEPIFLPIGQTTELEATFRPTKAGQYTANAYATYGPNKTEAFEIQFVVKKTSLLAVLILLALITAVLASGLWWFYHRKKKRAKKGKSHKVRRVYRKKKHK